MLYAALPLSDRAFADADADADAPPLDEDPEDDVHFLPPVCVC